MQLYNYERLFNKTIGRLTHRFYLQNGYADYYKTIIKSGTYCNGYFQSEKFFPNDVNELKKDLTISNSIIENNPFCKKIIDDDKSVCVSIRLGDYLNNPVHGVCKLEWYFSAMMKMKEELGSPNFYVFSDDIEELKDAFTDKFNVVFESESGIKEDYLKLQMMANCKHFIISNSSYSWWAQYLSENKDKIVIAPNKWYNIDLPCDIYQDNWILLNV